MVEEFHMNMIHRMRVYQDVHIALRRYQDVCKLLDDTISMETDLEFRAKLRPLKRPLKRAARALSKARKAVSHISAIQKASGAHHFTTRMKRHDASQRTIPFDGFMLRMQVQDGVSSMFQAYTYKMVDEVRDVTSGVLTKMATIVQEKLLD